MCFLLYCLMLQKWIYKSIQYKKQTSWDTGKQNLSCRKIRNIKLLIEQKCFFGCILLPMSLFATFLVIPLPPSQVTEFWISMSFCTVTFVTISEKCTVGKVALCKSSENKNIMSSCFKTKMWSICLIMNKKRKHWKMILLH